MAITEFMQQTKETMQTKLHLITFPDVLVDNPPQVELNYLTQYPPQVELDYLTQSRNQSGKRSSGLTGLLARWASQHLKILKLKNLT